MKRPDTKVGQASRLPRERASASVAVAAASPTGAGGTPALLSTLIDELLEEQRRLTAVERFARQHERHELPAQEKVYRDLIPLTKPRAGEQYAFEVDLDACTGCKACVTACHSLNGLDDTETWRNVGVLIGGTPAEPFQQTVTTACHHCADPGCLNGCPVEAYEKDPATGIVRHLDDQCIGCRSCVLKCPYDVPKYSERLGIVRKCDLCHSRLAAGEAPACVQSCPNEAIRVTLVKPTGTFIEGKESVWLPDSPNPGITLPTTRYVTDRSRPAQLKAGDHYELKPEKAHPPLVFMLVLTQAAVGTLMWASLLPWLTPGAGSGVMARAVTLAALIFGSVGLLASVLHLGRPLGAWRAFLGWRHSWLSREILAFGAFMPLAALVAGQTWGLVPALPPWISGALLPGAALIGLFAVFTSVMVYVDTQREFWAMRFTAAKFFGTAVLLGAATLFGVTHGLALSRETALASAALLILTSVAKLRWEESFFAHLGDRGLGALKRSALLMAGDLGLILRVRRGFGILGGVVLPLMALVPGTSAALAWPALALCFVAELAERHLFFVAVTPKKMPGNL